MIIGTTPTRITICHLQRVSDEDNAVARKCTCHHSENKNMAKVNKIKNVIRKRNLIEVEVTQEWASEERTILK